MWFKRFGKKLSPRHEQIATFLKTSFGLSTKNFEIYELAFRHSSAAKKISSKLKNSNERLEFLGDAVLDIIVADYLYHNHPDLDEGKLTKMKARVVSRKYLNVVGNNIGLHDLLQLQIGKQMPHQSIIGNAFEALVGALYSDIGFEKTFDIVVKLLQTQELDARVFEQTDFKSKLHEWSQKRKKDLRFKLLREEKSEGNTFYAVEVFVDGKSFGSGQGKSKKMAEQEAAKIACGKIFTN